MGCCESTKTKPNIIEGSLNAYYQNQQNNGNQNSNQLVQNNKQNQGNRVENNQIQSLNSNLQRAYPKGKAVLLRKLQGDEKQDNPQDNLKKKIEVYLTLNNLPSEGTYRCEIIIHEEGCHPIQIAKLSPQQSNGRSLVFNDFVEMYYFFEKDQSIQLIITAVSTGKTFEVKEPISKIAAMIKDNAKLRHQDSGMEIILDVRPIKSERKRYTFNITVDRMDNKANYKELYLVLKNFNDNKAWRGVYKTEESSNMTFDAFSIAEDDLFLGDPNKKFLIELQSPNPPMVIGSIEDNITNLSKNPMVELRSTDGKPTNTYLKLRIEALERYTFVELLKKGLQISLMVAIDFTASNRDPSDPNSLHYVLGLEPNQYERAIRSCGSIVSYYDSDQKFPLLGFGGIPQGKTDVEHVFPLNFSNDPNVYGIEEMVRVYRESLTKTTLAGPTFFAPLLRNMKGLVENVRGVYFTIMILTDGQITDIDETIDAIVECSFYPISIIIIGIGSGEFYSMVRLDGDDMPLTDSFGRCIARDIVQFVPFKKFEGNAKKLSEEVLRELPGQIEKFYIQTTL